MHVHRPIFHGQLKGRKMRPKTLIVWVLGRVKKMPKKGSLKVKKFHGDSVKNESARTKTTGGGAPNAPSPACLGLKPAKL